jgi:hypothetical protein
LFRNGRNDTVEIEVVGVVGDARLHGVVGTVLPQVYLPFRQDPPFGTVSVAVGAVVVRCPNMSSLSLNSGSRAGGRRD